MTTPAGAHTPAYDVATLTTCDTEPIHVPGAIQPHGVLLAVDGDQRVVTASHNTSSMLGNSTEVTYTVTEYVPQQRFQLRGDASAMQLLDTITFAGDETATTVTYHAEFHPQGAAKVIEPLLPLGLKRIGDKTADQLEETLRSLPGSTA